VQLALALAADRSVAAILVPGLQSPELVQALDEACQAARYQRRDGPLPAGYRPADGEWLALAVSPAAPPRMALLLPEHLGEVFRIACFLSRVRPELPILALRRYRGLPPVAKYLLGGEPRWKDGADDDLEVAWEVPSRPADCQGRVLAAGLPGDAARAIELLEGALVPYATAVAQGATILAYLERASRLAT
jgi:hypothetical protein